jgi:putative hemolysin
MDTNPEPYLSSGIFILIVFILIFFTAICAAAEKAQKASNKVRANAHEQFELRGAITLFGLGIYAVILLWLQGTLSSFLNHSNIPGSTIISMILLLFLATFLVLVFGEIYPKKWAAQQLDRAANLTENPVKWILLPLKPLLWLMSATGNLLLRITGQKIHLDDEEFSEEEIMSMLETGQETGALKEEGKKMIDSIFAFDDKFAYEIMTPRTNVFAININDPSEKYIDTLMELRYSRIPVFDEDSDNIIGIIHIKDYLIKAREAGFENVDLHEILRKPFFVPDTKYIDTLFFELQKTRQHIAILIDEYGGFSGIVTLEDIIEEVMGNIDDEYDEEEPKIQLVDEDTYRIDGTMYLDDINDELLTDLESENIETLGGLLIEILGEIPSDGNPGTVVNYGKYTFTIESVQDRRIGKVLVHIESEKTEEESTEEKKEKE